MKSWIQEDRLATMRKTKMIQYAYSCESVVKYDFLGLFWMGFFIKRKIWLGRTRNQAERQFCSEFYFNAKGIEGAQYKTPKDAMLSGTEILGALSHFFAAEAIANELIPIPR